MRWGAHGHDHDIEQDHARRHEHAHVHGRGEEPDRVDLTHLGLDIGSATVHLVLCRLGLVSEGGPHGELRVAERRIQFRSPVFMTPYKADGSLDDQALAAMLEQAQEGAPLAPSGTDAAVAVLTGPAAEGARADAISALLQEHGRPFACVAAGPHLAAALAAYGSDAVARSVGPHGEPRTVLNADISGTMARLALCRNGEVIEPVALGVGPRLVVLDEEGKVCRMEPSAHFLAEDLGIQLEPGEELAASNQRAIAEQLAECLFNVLERRPPEPLTQRLLFTAPLSYADRINAISFSGGAAEYIYDNKGESYGDLGPLFGRAVRQCLNRLGIAVQEPEHLLRATIMGAAQYRMEDVHGTPVLAEPPSFGAARRRDAEMLVHPVS